MVPNRDGLHPALKLMVVPSFCLLSGKRQGCTPGCRCGERPELYCGVGLCDGSCGLPVLTLRPSWSEKPYRAYGDQVACGPLWQDFRIRWPGPTVDLLTIVPWLDVDEEVKGTWWY